ncbi:alpha/beta hydrolase [Nocardioidaceae bacterium]|nr:alpha/beta hydrolase [Nocardioidaceae bacterium]
MRRALSWRSGRRRTRLLALPLAAASVTLAACSAGPGDGSAASPTPVPLEEPASDVAPTEPPEPDLSAFYEQRLQWRACGNGAQCSTLTVPLDYEAPQEQTIDIAVIRRRATGDGMRLGSLVTNPGGPGASGVQFVAQSPEFLGQSLRAAYDVVGFDPRGVGRSEPIDCLADDELDAFVASDPTPETEAERQTSERLLTAFGEGCVERSGELTGEIGTEEAARDMDVLRAALGDSTLSYLGLSYGTFLGATYAGLFPDRVGRMVLDGAIDPAVSNLDLNLTQAQGFETATQAYLQGCVDTGDCPLGDDVDAAGQALRDLLDGIDEQALPTASPRRLEIGNAVYGVWAALYNEASWPALDAALAQALQGDGTTLLQLSDAYVQRSPNGYVSNATEALVAINCLDHSGGIETEEAAQLVPRFEEISPTWGEVFAYGLVGCREWPVDSGREPAPITAEGAAPILVVGTTRDPATPLKWARALAEQLDSGVLLERDGDGHLAYSQGNACVDETVEAFLVSGEVPEETVRC